MYRRLDEAHIVDTLRRLELRIGERFPGSGLGKVSAELLAAATESVERIRRLRRPNLPLRISTWTLIAVIVFIALEALLHLGLAPRWVDFAAFLGSSQAIQNVVFLGLAVLFSRTSRRGSAATARSPRFTSCEASRISSTCTS